jgi:hypothetical protein
LFIEVDDPEVTADLINEDLKSIQSWADKWRVSFSPPKTEDLLISRKRKKREHPLLYLNDVEIKRVAVHKHLGLSFSNDLTWNVHIGEILTKATKKLGILRLLRYKLDRLSLERIYKCLIRPVLEYADCVWNNPNANNILMDSLEKFQLNAARVVTGATARCDTARLYLETKWETLSKRRANHRLLQLYKIKMGKAPSYLRDLLPNNVEARTRYALRNNENMDVPTARIEIYSRSFYPSTARLWNNLPENHRQSPSVASFKYAQKVLQEKSNPLYYFGERKVSVIHSRLRIRCSVLKAHLFHELHVIDSPLCPCGTGEEEDNEHFFLKCTKFDQARMVMRASWGNLTLCWPPPIDYLLFGIPDQPHPINIHIFTIVHQYLYDTERFN